MTRIKFWCTFLGKHLSSLKEKYCSSNIFGTISPGDLTSYNHLACQTEVGLKGTYSHVTSSSLRNLHKPQFHTPTVWAVRITKEVWQGWSRRMPVRVSQRICYLQTLNICQPMKAFPRSSVRQQSACNAGDPGSIPGSGGSPGVGDGNPLRYSCLENPTDRGAWRATVHGVAKSDPTARLGTHAAVTAAAFLCSR